MATRMQQRRGTAAAWTAANTVLTAGEIGFETDTLKFKIGNGSTAWTALAYSQGTAGEAAISRSGAVTGQVPVLQANGTLAFADIAVIDGGAP